MNLNKVKNIRLCQKALSVKELEYYSKLCEIYNELAQTQPYKRPDEIERRYSRALTLASRGITDFLEEPDCIYSSDESALIRDYSFKATTLLEFKEASHLLEEVLPNDENNKKINFDKLDDYFDYMQNTSKSTKKFDDFIYQHSNRYIGHEYLTRSWNAIRTINLIDPRHVPNNLSRLTPKLFGAEITGYRISLKKTIQDAQNIFTDSEVDKYSPDLTIKEHAKETLYSTQKNAPELLEKASTIYHDHKHQIKVAALAVIVATGAYTSINKIQDTFTKSHQFATTNQENGYKNSYSNELIQNIITLQEKTSNADLSAEEISEIKQLVLETLDKYDTENAIKYCTQNGYDFVEQSTYYNPAVELFPYSQSITYIKDGIENSKSVNYLCEPENLREDLNSDNLSSTQLSKVVDKLDNLAGNNVTYTRLLGAQSIPTEKSNVINLNFTSNSKNDNDERV